MRRDQSDEYAADDASGRNGKVKTRQISRIRPQAGNLAVAGHATHEQRAKQSGNTHRYAAVFERSRQSDKCHQCR